MMPAPKCTPALPSSLSSQPTLHVSVSSSLPSLNPAMAAPPSYSSSSSVLPVAKELSYREVPAELQLSLQLALEWAVNCRPSNIITFMKVFFNDERDNATKELKTLAHALHAIPLVLHREAALKDYACTIYCHYNMIANPSNSQLSLKSNINSLLLQKSGLAVGGVRIDNNRSNILYNSIYNGMKCDYFDPVTIVDNIMEKISGSSLSLNDSVLNYSAKFNHSFPIVDTQDFKSFINYLRVPVACFLANEWLKGVLKDYHEYNPHNSSNDGGGGSNSSSSGSSISSSIILSTPTKDRDFLGNKLNLLSYLRNKLAYTSLEEAVNFSTGWHADDHQKWSTLLFQVLENPNYTSKLSTFQDLCNIFIIEAGAATIAGFTGNGTN